MKTFRGYLGNRMIAHLKFRRSLGNIYKDNERVLLKFNKIIIKKWPKAKTVSQEMVMTFLRSNSYKKISTRKLDLIYIRMFCKDLAATDNLSYIPQCKILPKDNQPARIHIFSETEILRIMDAAKSIRSHRASLNYVTLTGLFWTTGLRIHEAVALNVGDINYKDKILTVQKGKFGKSRLIPISESTISALFDHIKKLQQLGFNVNQGAPLFISPSGNRLQADVARSTLRTLYRAANIKTTWGGIPRTIDIRHSFATHSLKAVQNSGSDPSSYIPALAVVMGHSNIRSTQVYLHPPIEKLQMASKAFEYNFLKIRKNK